MTKCKACQKQFDSGIDAYIHITKEHRDQLQRGKAVSDLIQDE